MTPASVVSGRGALAALELTTPVALWGLAAAVPITLLHLYFRRRRRVLVPFAPLLVEAQGPVKKDARFRRLRDGLALGARLLALALAVFALAGLRPAEATKGTRDLLLVVDADVTTAAREAGSVLRLGRGLALAEAWARHVPYTSDETEQFEAAVGVILAEQTPRLLVAPTRDRAAALGKLGAVPLPAATTTDLAAAVTMALDMAATRGATQVVVLTSRPYEPPAEPPDGVEVRVEGIGVASDDQGIVDATVRRTADPPGYRARLTVRNVAPTGRTRRLVVRVGDAVVAEQDVVLDGRARTDVDLTLPAPPEGAWLTCRLEGTDAFPADDRFDAWLAPRQRPHVRVVHDGAVRPYTAATMAALAKSGYIDEQKSGYVDAASFRGAGPGAVVVVDGVALADEALGAGAYVFLGPLQGALPFRLGRTVDRPLIWRTVPNHPMLRDLDFRRAHVVRGQALTGTGLVPLAFAEGLPVIAEGQNGGVRYVVLALDPEGSALPVQAALPLLVRNAILRLAEAPVSSLKPFYRAGEVLRPLTTVPGGPTARIAWEGPATDGLLAPRWMGGGEGRVDPRGVGWRIPQGAMGRAEVRTGADDDAWIGRTAFLDADASRTVVPARPLGEAPEAAEATMPRPVLWRRVLLALAVLFLLLDLALSFAGARRRGAA